MSKKNFSLHIGVNRYSNLTDNDLLGAENDARRWRRVMKKHLRAKATVLLSEDATTAGIIAAVTALAVRVGEAGAGATALISFSGHGAATELVGLTRMGRTQAICPSDVTIEDGEVVGAIPIQKLMELMGEHRSDTTFVIDACYTQTGGSVAQRRLLGRGGGLEALQESQGEGGVLGAGRLMLGCLPWEESFEIKAGGEVHGAFTYALLTLIEQWSVQKTPEGGRYLNASYGDLMFRTRELLTLLGLEQTPELLGLHRTALIPFLRPGSDIRADMTSRAPDGWRAGSQLSGGEEGGYRIYALKVKGWEQDSTGTWSNKWVTLAHMLVARIDSPDYSATSSTTPTPTFKKATEYWKLEPAVAKSIIYKDQTSVQILGVELQLSTADTAWSQTEPPEGWTGTLSSAPEKPGASLWSPASSAPTSGAGNYSKAFGCASTASAPSSVFLEFLQVSDTAPLKKIFWFRTTTNPANLGPWFGDLKVKDAKTTLSTQQSTPTGTSYYPFSPAPPPV